MKVWLVFFWLLLSPFVGAAPLTLDQVLKAALEQDAELQRLLLSQKSRNEKSIADKQLPDPVIKLGLLNLPTDRFCIGSRTDDAVSPGSDAAVSGGRFVNT